MQARRRGFTLLEVVIALGLTGLVFAIASQTLFSCVRVTGAVRSTASEATGQYRFLAAFRDTASLMLQEPDTFEGSADTVRFLIRRPDAPEPVRVTFAVRADEDGAPVVWQKEETLFTQRTVVFPAWRPAQNTEVTFSYSAGEEWADSWEDAEKMPASIAVKLSSAEWSFVFPVATRQ